MVHLKERRLQIHIAALECQPRRLPTPITLFLVCDCVVFYFLSNLALQLQPGGSFPFSCAFLRSSTGADKHTQLPSDKGLRSRP